MLYIQQALVEYPTNTVQQQKLLFRCGHVDYLGKEKDTLSLEQDDAVP